ncbi:MAG: tetratricopeptide repeat protein [Acidobacteriota bacterium]
MKKHLVVLMIIGVLSVTVFAIRPVKRIVFPKGATKVSVTGYLNGYKDSQVYLIKLRKGQTLKFDANKPVSLYISDPSGEDASDMDLSCHSHQVVENTKAGDYKIKAVECGKADAWKGSFKLSVSVENKRNDLQSKRISESTENNNSSMQKAVDLSVLNENIEKAKNEFESTPQDTQAKMKLADAHFERAFALTEAAQYRSALGDFRKGLKLNPNNKEAKDMHDQIISIFESIGRTPPKEGEEPTPLPIKKS